MPNPDSGSLPSPTATDTRAPRSWPVRLWTALTTFGVLRLIATTATLALVVHAISESASALSLSTGAPFGWRAQLLLLEGGLPLLFALGFACAAWGSPVVRHLGWIFAALLSLAFILWAWLVAPTTALAAGGALLTPPLLFATLDPDSRAALIEQLYRQHSGALITFARRACTRAAMDPALAEDLLHDLFAECADPDGPHDTVLRCEPQLVKGWLYKAISHRLSTRWRSEQRRDERATAMAWTALSLVPSPDEVYDDVELQAVIDATLPQAPPRAVEAYRLVREQGLSYAEAGEVMGISPSSVGAHLVRVARLLQPALADWWTAPPVGEPV